jgi:hypothetical protein
MKKCISSGSGREDLCTRGVILDAGTVRPHLAIMEKRQPCREREGSGVWCEGDGDGDDRGRGWRRSVEATASKFCLWAGPM